MCVSEIAVCFPVIFGIYANESFSHINKTEMDELILQTEGTVPQDLADLFLQVLVILSLFAILQFSGYLWMFPLSVK